MEHATVLIAMSGGVDSSVSAYLMLQHGYRCMGAIMRLHEASNETGMSQNIEDARSVADRLHIPFHVLDMTAAFQTQVMDDFVRCYETGLTPNPCVQCNRCLKFGQFLDCAVALGCTHIATGHYARISKDPVSGRYLLQKAADPAKDQSYFLYPLTQQQLSHTIFPLGDLTKEQARQIALQQGFVNARKQDSQDVCFIPDGDYMAFLKRYTGKEYTKGNFLDLDGNVVGQHQGAVAYTLGQRKGLGIALGKPAYVCSKDMAANTVTVGPNEALFHTTLLANNWNWISTESPKTPICVHAKARSRMTEQPATVYPEENGYYRVVFDTPQRALTPGQAVVLYDGDTVVGGGTITEIL